jgi:hypothetical protein
MVTSANKGEQMTDSVRSVLDENEPKLCPFCGGPASKDRYGWCSCIEAFSGADDLDKKCFSDTILKIEDWNTRPLESALLAENERLRSALNLIACAAYPVYKDLLLGEIVDAEVVRNLVGIAQDILKKGR